MPTPLLLSTCLALPLLAQDVRSPAVDLAAEYDPRLTPEVLVVRQAAPAVVFVEAQRPFVAGWDRWGRSVQQLQPVSGSGVVVDKSGFIVTNYHVVGNDAREIQVSFDPDLDPLRYRAELVSYVADEDLALLKIRGEREFPVVRRGTSSDLMIGERVIAIGNPYRQRLSVSAGIISGLHRDVEIGGAGGGGGAKFRFNDLIQTDASINPGNSGGPLLNILGELIGINCAVNAGAENMGFAIPVDRVEEVLRDHLFAPSAARAWLGFEVDEERGFTLCEVSPGGPASLAGLQQGERLLEIQGAPIRTSEDYRLQRLPLLPNQPVALKVEGPAGARVVELRGWDKAAGALFQRAGMTVETCAVGSYARVLVERVLPGGPAERLGLQPGDVIDAIQVKGNPRAWRVGSATAFASLIAGVEPGRSLELEIVRDDDRNGRLTRSELYRGSLTLR